jgi:hypothetical protein
MPGIVQAARERGVDVTYGAPTPDGDTAGRRGVRTQLPYLARD